MVNFSRNVTRKKFLKILAAGVLAIFILPGLKNLNFFKKEYYKEAKYYKKLAG
jgi:hypothetical protein